MLAGHDQHAGLARQRVDVRIHAELAAHVREQLVQRVRIGQMLGRLEVHAHEEQARAVFSQQVTKLLRIDDVATGLVQQTRDGMHDALGIRT